MESGAQSGPLASAYEVLAQMAPMILPAQANGKIAAVSLDKSFTSRRLRLGDYQLDITLARSFRVPDAVPDTIGYGLFIATGPNEYYMAGDGIQVTFSPVSGGVASIANQESGRFENGKWIPTRQLGGDDSVLRYDIGRQAELGQSGTGVKFPAGKCGIQRVEVYRYQ